MEVARFWQRNEFDTFAHSSIVFKRWCSTFSPVPHNLVASSNQRPNITVIVFFYLWRNCTIMHAKYNIRRAKNEDSVDEKWKFSFCMHISNWDLISLYRNAPYISIKETGTERERERHTHTFFARHSAHNVLRFAILILMRYSVKWICSRFLAGENIQVLIVYEKRKKKRVSDENEKLFKRPFAFSVFLLFNCFC